MVKSVVNPTYLASANAAYSHGGFVRRAYRQRRPTPYSADLCDFVSPDSLAERGATGLLLGVFLGYGHHSEEVQYEAWSVEDSRGKFAMYRIHKPGHDFVLCDHSGYVLPR